MTLQASLTIEQLRDKLPASHAYRMLSRKGAETSWIPIAAAILAAVALGASFVGIAVGYDPHFIWAAGLLMFGIASAYISARSHVLDIREFNRLTDDLLEKAQEEIGAIENQHPKAIVEAALPFRRVLGENQPSVMLEGHRESLLALIRDYDKLLRNPIDYLRALNLLDIITSNFVLIALGGVIDDKPEQVAEYLETVAACDRAFGFTPVTVYR
jgi:hypothetical protein